MGFHSVTLEEDNMIKIKMDGESSGCGKQISCFGINMYFLTKRISDYLNMLSIKLEVVKKTENYIYACILNSQHFKKKDVLFLCNDSEYRTLGKLPKNSYADLTIKIIKKLQPTQNQFSVFYEDEELTDFELRGEDGSSVQVHSFVLAASSPVFRAMLGKEYKETKDRSYHIKDATQTTLQNLKDYMYNSAVPESNCLQLLQLAKCYMMPELQKICFEQAMKEFGI